MELLQQFSEGARNLLPRVFWSSAILGVALVSGDIEARTGSGSLTMLNRQAPSMQQVALSGSLVKGACAVTFQWIMEHESLGSRS